MLSDVPPKDEGHIFPGAFVCAPFLHRGETQATLQVWSTAETDPDSLKLTIQTCKPEAAFKNPEDVITGKGHCEVHPMLSDVPPKDEGHIFPGAFVCAPFLRRGENRRCKIPWFAYPHATAFKTIRRHIVTHKPPVVFP